jgi:hypothetical protein
MEEQSAKFTKVYANLPIGLRSEIVVVIDEVGPITWNAAYVEVSNKTDLGAIILRQLEKLGII